MLDLINMHLLIRFLRGLLYCCIDNFSSFYQADLLDVVGVLHVGGLPKNYSTKRIGPVKDTYRYTHTFFKVTCLPRRS